MVRQEEAKSTIMKITQPVRNLQRLREVQGILLRYGFDILFEQEEIQEIRRILRNKLKLSLGEFDGKTMQERVRLMFEELGPTYVKLGQILSSRTDMLSDEWISELTKLQDNVPPFPVEQANQIIINELGKSPEEIFFSFNPKPIAAASLGQVHQAVLLDMSEVVVKIQRPNIERQVTSDIEIMKEVARLIEVRTSWGKQFEVVSVVNEFAETLKEEMDYLNEANNAERLTRNMADQKDIHVPLVYWDYTSTHVLTLEAIQGVKINNLSRLDESGVDRRKLADTFIRSIFKQVMVDGFFHADPHPGNLLVNLEDHSLNYIDLGMMGRLIPELREVLGEILRAIINNDSAEIVRLLMIIGKPFGEINEHHLQRTIDKIVGKYLDASLSQISLANVLNEILSTLNKHKIRLPVELTMAIKPIILGEGVAYDLDPSIQIIEIAHSVARQVILDQIQPRVIAMEITKTLRETNRLAKTLPRTLESILKQVDSGSLRIGLEFSEFSEQIQHLETITNRMSVGLILAGMVIGSAIAMGVPPQGTWKFIPVLGIIGFIASMVIAFILVWAIFWDILFSKRRKK